MTPEITIREADISDVPSMEACATRAYADMLGKLEGMPDVVGGMAEDVAAHTGIVAEAGGELTGFVIMVEGEGAVKVANLACDPAFSGRGVARRLLDEVAQRARALGKVRLELVTHEGMDSTQAFYRHLGWRETGRWGQAVVFCKPL